MRVNAEKVALFSVLQDQLYVVHRTIYILKIASHFLRTLKKLYIYIYITVEMFLKSAPCNIYYNVYFHLYIIIVVAKTTAAQNEVALTYHKVRGLYFLAVVFAASIIQNVLISWLGEFSYSSFFPFFSQRCMSL